MTGGAASGAGPRPGLFITLEGPEGSGKSLQARLLVERLRTAGQEVVATREPGGTPLGDQLRETLLLRADLDLQPRTQALILCAARAQHVDQLILPSLRGGRTVVCDRFADSTLAYQGYGHGLGLAELRAATHLATGGLQPDLTLLLDVPVREGLRRKASQRSSGAEEAWNRFEAEAEAFHERVRSGYHALADAEPARWRVFDASKAPETLAEEIWAMIASYVCP